MNLFDKILERLRNCDCEAPRFWFPLIVLTAFALVLVWGVLGTREWEPPERIPGRDCSQEARNVNIARKLYNDYPSDAYKDHLKIRTKQYDDCYYDPKYKLWH